MTRIIGVAASLALATVYFVLSALPAFTADNGTTNLTVTVAAPCVTLTGADVDFGTLPFITSGPGNISRDAQTKTAVTNCSAAAENVFARGTDATSGSSTAKWMLSYGATAGLRNPCPDLNTYQMGVADFVGDGGSQELEATSKLLANYDPGEQDSYVNRLVMPCVGSAGAGELMSFQVIYTASL